MKVLSAIVGGFAGACTVTLLNEVIKRFDKEAPRIDLLGMEAMEEVNDAMDVGPLTESQTYYETLGAELLSNTIYFSFAGANEAHTEVQGGLQGAAAGLAAIYAPGVTKFLDKEHSGATDKTKALTTAYYFIGGLVAAKVMKWVEEKLNKEEDENQLKLVM